MKEMVSIAIRIKRMVMVRGTPELLHAAEEELVARVGSSVAEIQARVANLAPESFVQHSSHHAPRFAGLRQAGRYSS